MGSSEGQTFCLRWNNHKANLVEILDALIKVESYVDCTIVVDEHVQFKAHRVVLAANSPYFQAILQDVPMDHCSILFPGVKEFEMRALLEYMYTGEVNVTQSQIPRIMKIAEQLEVKGLYDMTDLKGKFETSNKAPPEESPTTGPPFPSLHNSSSTIKPVKTSPVISTSNNVTSAAQSSSSPPYNNFKPYQGLYSARSPIHTPERPPWSIASALESPISTHPGLLSRVYETAPDNNPLKRKKLSSISSMMSTSMDTPILRNVLAQSNAADSSQPLPLIPTSAAERRDERASSHSNGTDYDDKKFRSEDLHSPYTDKSFEDESMEQSPSFSSDSRIASYVPQQNQKPEWKRYKQYTRTHLEMAIECVKNGMSALQAARKYGVPSRTLYDKVKKMGITTGRPMQRTMKRSPSNGNPMPFPYGLSGTSHNYHPDLPSQSHPHDEDRRERDMCPLPPTIPPHAAALLGPTFLQQALDARGGDITPMQAMAFAAAAHAAANGIATSPGTGAARSPSPNIIMKYMRPSSTELMQQREEREREEREHELRERERENLREFERERERERDRDREIGREREREMCREMEMRRMEAEHRGNGNDEEEVEDLSMSRKSHIKIERPPSEPNVDRSLSPPQAPAPAPHLQTKGVIVPPLSQVIQRLKEARFDESDRYDDNIVNKESLESNQ